MITVTRYLAILLGALALAFGINQAMSPEPASWLLPVAATLQLAAVIAAILLAAAQHHLPGRGLAIGGTIVVVLSGLLWWAAAVPEAAPQWLTQFISLPQSVMLPGLAAPVDLRVLAGKDLDLAALVAWLVGFSLLVLSAVRAPVIRRARGPLPLVNHMFRRSLERHRRAAA